MTGSESDQSARDASPIRRHVVAAGLLFVLTVLAVLLAQLGFALWIAVIALLVVIVQAMLFAVYFGGDTHKTKSFCMVSIPSVMLMAFFNVCSRVADF